MSTFSTAFWSTVIAAETRRSLTILRSYLFDTVVGLLSVYGLFLVLFFGLRFFAQDQFDNARLDSIIVGYILWMFALNAYVNTSMFIIEEAQQGTLEQLFLSPAGFHRLLAVRLFVAYLSSLGFNACLLLLTMLTTGRWLDIPWLPVLAMLTLALPAVYGIGYLVAGLALLYKRVASISNMLQFGLIALVSLPAFPFSWLSLLPFSAAAGAIRQAIVEGQPLALWWYGYAALNGSCYFMLGVALFRLCERRARRLNVLGHY